MRDDESPKAATRRSRASERCCKYIGQMGDGDDEGEEKGNRKGIQIMTTGVIQKSKRFPVSLSIEI